ncbi:MAG TPA: hypothetical protein VHE83_14645 [Mycobacteriales bacterium]|nr:hypothetical protein [Mycobacteriales bacterium]
MTIRRLPVLVASLAVASTAVAVLATPASARPRDAGCASSTQSLHGEIRGSDGLFVDATLAFDLEDSSGHALAANGCRATSATPAFFVNPNYTVPADGATSGGTFEWSLDGIPSNAVKVEIETYPRNPAAAPKYQVTNTKYYARSMRHFALPSSDDIQVVMPRADACPGPDGIIGSRTVRAYVVHWNGRSASFTRDSVTMTDAFSALADRNTPGFGNPVMGLGIGTANSDGTVTLAQLSSAGGLGQPYTMVFRAGHAGGRAYSTDYRGRQTFGVTACSSGFATIYEIPALSTSSRHALADYLYAHGKGFLVTANT